MFGWTRYSFIQSVVAFESFLLYLASPNSTALMAPIVQIPAPGEEEAGGGCWVPGREKTEENAWKKRGLEMTVTLRVEFEGMWRSGGE
ncbi:hypothetical protein Pmani_004871 [Petrolisthes manimaculis]|uniref:Uncharacterized protein n=1 Tax=Petrolisthes manimaculis TaxID=1843537 RepID=A0AAE1QF18_9EUCA|nr:hypothetical protein Pmani_004871 [Petrolisthes manimaculis]